MPPVSLPAGTKAYLRIFFQRIQAGSGTQKFVYRVVNPTDMDDRFVVRRYTTTTSTANGGTVGHDGTSLDVVYRRSSTALTTPPTGGVAHNDQLISAPTGWSITVPSGTDPIYTAFAHINGVTQSIRYSEPVQWTGPQGQQGIQGTQGIQGNAGPTGPKGDSSAVIWRLAGSTPNTPTGISINSSGTWTDLTATNGDVWVASPSMPHSGLNLYQQNFLVDYSSNPPGLSALGNPFEASIRGDTGPRGAAGESGFSITAFYMRTATDTPPARASITYNGLALGNFGTWHPNTVPAGTGAYIWRFNFAYQIGVVGGTPTPVVQYTAQRGAMGPNGFGYQSYFIANTATTVTAPTITYNGTAFTATAGWTTAFPTTPVGANVFESRVRYQEGTAGQVALGVIRIGTVAGAVAPPVDTSRSYTLYYGLVDGGTEDASSRQSLTFTLTPGQTYSQANLIAYPVSTTATQDYFVRFSPTTDLDGSSLTVHTQFGDITSRVTGTLATRFVIPLHALGLQGHYRISIRRNP